MIFKKFSNAKTWHANYIVLPQYVNAVQLEPYNAEKVEAITHGKLKTRRGRPVLTVTTTTGKKKAHMGDWILIDPQNHIYVLNQNKFHHNYERETLIYDRVEKNEFAMNWV